MLCEKSYLELIYGVGNQIQDDVTIPNEDKQKITNLLDKLVLIIEPYSY